MGFFFTISFLRVASELIHSDGQSFDLSNPMPLLGLLVGGTIVLLIPIGVAVLSKWSLLPVLGFRPKILRLIGVASAELLILLGISCSGMLAPEMRWVLPMTAFAMCAVFPNLLLLPATNQNVDNWFLKRSLYAFGLASVSALCVILFFSLSLWRSEIG